MGIPRFSRWLIDRYPLILTHSADPCPPVDNLYVDMNNLIHLCTHHETPVNERSISVEDAAAEVCAAIQTLVGIARPRRRILLAVDGVAPRAKMNQQRQRRFRSIPERTEAREKAKNTGRLLIDEDDVFKSSCISPGTVFMNELSVLLQTFVSDRVGTDPLWADVDVIYSGHDVPGEGEHKIMQFLRRSKMAGAFHPSEVHFMYGLDADLVMLALASHEPHFILFRCVDVTRNDTLTKTQRNSMMHITALRECLALDLFGTTHPVDLERAIDDFVLMCMLIGNDFIPCLPTLTIRDDVLTRIFDVYKAVNIPARSFLCDGHVIDMPAVGRLLEASVCRDELATYQRSRIVQNTMALPPMTWQNETTLESLKAAHYSEWKVGDVAALAKDYVAALHWVMAYYYIGCPSWRWCFSHHTSPFPSDLLAEMAASATTTIPFPPDSRPYNAIQQLLFVLPSQSADLLPEAYRGLLTEPASPLAPHMPAEGAEELTVRGDWILPLRFIPTDVLEAAYDSITHTEEHAAVCRVGPTIVSRHGVPPVVVPNTEDDVRQMPFLPWPTDGADKVSHHNIVSLRSHGPMKHAMEMTAMPPKGDMRRRLILSVATVPFAAEDIRSLVGQVVTVGFQQVVRAVVTEVCDDKNVYRKGKQAAQADPLAFHIEMARHREALLRRYGLVLPERMSSILRVRRCLGFAPWPASADGHRPLYAAATSAYPSELLVTAARPVTSSPPRPALDTARLLRGIVGTDVLMSDGRVGTVIKCDESGSLLDVNVVESIPAPQSPHIGERFVNVREISRRYNVGPRVVQMMTGALPLLSGPGGQRSKTGRFGLHVHKYPESRDVRPAYCVDGVSGDADEGHYLPFKQPTRLVFHERNLSPIFDVILGSAEHSAVRDYVERNAETIATDGGGVAEGDAVKKLGRRKVDAFASAIRDWQNSEPDARRTWIISSAMMAAPTEKSLLELESAAIALPPPGMLSRTLVTDVPFEDVHIPMCHTTGRASVAHTPLRWASVPRGSRVAFGWSGGVIPLGARGTLVDYAPARGEALVVFDSEHKGCHRIGSLLRTWRGWRTPLASLFLLRSVM